MYKVFIYKLILPLQTQIDIRGHFYFIFKT